MPRSAAASSAEVTGTSSHPPSSVRSRGPRAWKTSRPRPRAVRSAASATAWNRPRPSPSTSTTASSARRSKSPTRARCPRRVSRSDSSSASGAPGLSFPRTTTRAGGCTGYRPRYVAKAPGHAAVMAHPWLKLVVTDMVTSPMRAAGMEAAPPSRARHSPSPTKPTSPSATPTGSLAGMPSRRPGQTAKASAATARHGRPSVYGTGADPSHTTPGNTSTTLALASGNRPALGTGSRLRSRATRTTPLCATVEATASTKARWIGQTRVPARGKPTLRVRLPRVWESDDRVAFTTDGAWGGSGWIPVDSCL